MNRKPKAAKRKDKHVHENKKRYVHEEINTSAMKRCWINPKTFILIPADADEDTERKKYLENRVHYNALYDSSVGGNTKKS